MKASVHEAFHILPIKLHPQEFILSLQPPKREYVNYKVYQERIKEQEQAKNERSLTVCEAHVTVYFYKYNLVIGNLLNLFPLSADHCVGVAYYPIHCLNLQRLLEIIYFILYFIETFSCCFHFILFLATGVHDPS